MFGHNQTESIKDDPAAAEAALALTDIARTYGVSHTTIGRLTSALSS